MRQVSQRCRVLPGHEDPDSTSSATDRDHDNVTGVSLYPHYDRSQATDSVTYSQNAFHAILKLRLAHIPISAFLGHPGQPLDRLPPPLSFFSYPIQFILEKLTD
jgi:hypothetical protein